MNYKESVFNISIPFDHRTILYNTYTGALMLLKHSLAEVAQTDQQEALIKQGFLVHASINEVNRLLMERKRELYTERIRHLHIEIAPTMACQAHCWYCFENNRHTKKTMTATVARDVVEFIKARIERASCKSFCLLFFGGEPLLAVDQICIIGEAIKKFCDERDIDFHSELITNGIAFTSETADRIISAIRLTNVQITLDGIRTTHDQAKGIECFDTVINNVIANSSKTKVSIRINVSKSNYSEVPALVDCLLTEKELDGKIRMYLARVDDLDSCSTSVDGYMDNYSFVDFRNNFVQDAVSRYHSFELSDLLPDIKRNYCGYEKISQVMIGPCGELYRCQRTMGNDNSAVGSIYEGEFYTDEEMEFFRNIDDQCLHPSICPLLPACFGGCPNERRKGKKPSYCKLKQQQIEKDLITYVHTVLNK